MTRKIQSHTGEEGRSRKRALKPAVEKKRRDRINQSLAELRSLLLSHSSDPRLKNPKIEKAEILDLAVEHLRKWTSERSHSDGFPESSSPRKTSDATAPALSSLESAGFQKCVARLSSYVQNIPAAQRWSLMEALELHAEAQQPRCRLREAEAPRGPDADASADADAVYTSERRDESRPWFPALSPFQPHSCSTPSHDYLSPPPSPWLSPSFSSYASSPSFPSFASFFSSPPSLSPLSSNTSLSSLSPTGPHPGPPALHCPPPLTLRPPPPRRAPGGVRPRPQATYVETLVRD